MKVRYKDEFGNYYGPITINEAIENKYQNVLWDNGEETWIEYWQIKKV